MKWLTVLSDFFTGNVFGEIRQAADDLFTSDEERLAFEERLNKIKSQTEISLAELQAKEDAEISKRWQSDNKAGWLTKNVRPLGLIYLLFVLTIMAFFDGNIGGFQIKSGYIGLYETLTVTAFVAYYGSRGWEKIKGATK
jgi:hypothetical protein